MQATFALKEEKLLQLQELVKAFNLRFVHNPRIYNGQATVTVDGDHLPMETCNEFFSAWNRANTQIREVESSKCKKILRRIKGLFNLT